MMPSMPIQRGLAHGPLLRLLRIVPITRVQVTDSVGAYPIHALVVRNSDISLSLSVRMFEVAPRMLTFVHLPPIFTGESCFHIVAVNQRESTFVRMLELVLKHVEANEVHARSAHAIPVHLPDISGVHTHRGLPPRQSLRLSRAHSLSWCALPTQPSRRTGCSTVMRRDSFSRLRRCATTAARPWRTRPSLG